MRVVVVLLLAAFLMACGSKSAVQKWQGSEEPLPVYSGPVCLLPGLLPSKVEFTFLGRAVANQQQYGGYAQVNTALANVARTVGADTVYDLRSKQKVGFFVVVRPQSWGMAARLKSPESFDCIAHGGRIYPGTDETSTSSPAAEIAPVSNAVTYDECMARVMRISDPTLRLQAMTACDGLKNP